MKPFRSTLPFEKTHPNALAVWCSDGRFTHAVEELFESLGEPRLDTLTLPGGPALLDMTSAGMTSLDVVREATSFLVKGHHIQRVVLIAHAECGYYKSRFGYESPESMRRRQLADLRGASRWLRTTHAGIHVLCYFAEIDEAAGGHGVRFEPADAC